MKHTSAALIAEAFIPMNRRVFVLADPAVCSELLQEAIQEHLEVSHVLKDKTAVQMNVILHVLQAGLGMQCHSAKVPQALKVRESLFVLVLLATCSCVLFCFS